MMGIVDIIDNTFFNFIDLFDFSKIYFLSFLSYYFFYLFFLLFTVYLYFFEKKQKIINSLILLSLIGFLAIYLFKYMIKRERPMGIIEKIDYSFPSSHSYFAALIFLFSIFFISNIFLKILFIFISIFSIFSILILKIHYFSDVVFSIILSVCLFYVVIYKEKILKAFLEKLEEVKRKIL